MPSISQKFFLNDYVRSAYGNPDAYNPVRDCKDFAISIPVVAFKVERVNKLSSENILKTTIQKLKTLGMSPEKISESVCLPLDVVNASLGEDQSINTDEKQSDPISSVSFYMFYDLLGKRFLRYGVQEEDYLKFTRNEVEQRGSGRYSIKKSVADTGDYTVCPILPDFSAITSVPVPSEEDIKTTFVDGEGDLRHNQLSFRSGVFAGVQEQINLVCHYYFSTAYAGSFFITNPLVKEYNSQDLDLEVAKIIEDYENSASKQNGLFMAERARFINQVANSGVAPKINQAVLNVCTRYSYNEIKQYRDTYSALVANENDHIRFLEVKVSPDEARKKDAVSRFIFSAYSAIEKILFAAVVKNSKYDDVVFVEKYASGLDKALEAQFFAGILSEIGLSGCDDFCNGISAKFVAKTMKQAVLGSQDRVMLVLKELIVANAVIAKRHPMDGDIGKMGEYFPSFLNDLMTLAPLRNKEGHYSKALEDGAFDSFSEGDVSTLYAIEHTLVKTLLKIKKGDGTVDEEKVEELPIDAQAEQKAKEAEIKEMELGEFERPITDLWKDFYSKDGAHYYPDAMKVLEEVFSILGAYCFNSLGKARLNSVIDGIRFSSRDLINEIAVENGASPSFSRDANLKSTRINFLGDINGEGEGWNMNIRPKIAIVVQCLHLYDKETLSHLFKDLPGWLDCYENLERLREHSAIAENEAFEDDEIPNKLTEYARAARQFLELK